MPVPSPPSPQPLPAGPPQSTSSIAGRMLGDAVRSTAAKVVAGVVGAIVAAGMLASAIANGPAGALGVLIVAMVVLFGLAFMLGIPAAIVVLIIASQRARRSEAGAMHAYATARRLSYSSDGSLPAATPLLSAGSSRRTQDLITGILPGGLQATLAHHTYTVRSGSGKNSHSVPYPNTLVLAQLPQAVPYVRKLLCYGGGRLGGRASLFGLDFSGDEEVTLESTALDERYGIKTGRGQDQAWLRELFTPVFIDWLTVGARPNFSFELADGLLVVSVAERLGSAYDMDWLCEAASYVAGRIQGEVLEEQAGPLPA